MIKTIDNPLELHRNAIWSCYEDWYSSWEDLMDKVKEVGYEPIDYRTPSGKDWFLPTGYFGEPWCQNSHSVYSPRLILKPLQKGTTMSQYKAEVTPEMVYGKPEGELLARIAELGYKVVEFGRSKGKCVLGADFQIYNNYCTSDINTIRFIVEKIKPDFIEVKLNDNHTAKVYRTKVEVGCQSFPVEKIAELAKALQDIQL